jgi:hypothetical protein
MPLDALLPRPKYGLEDEREDVFGIVLRAVIVG